MRTRTVFFLLAALAAMLTSCSKEQKTAQETSAKEQVKPEKVEGTSAADTTVASRYFAKGEQFTEEAKYDSAIAYYQKAGVLYETISNWEKYILSCNKIGRACLGKGDYSQAWKYLNQALETGQKQLGQQHPQVALTYHTLGNFYYFKSAFDSALFFYNKAVSIRIAVLGERHKDVGNTYNNMGNVYYDKGDLDQALAFYNKTLSIDLATGGEQNPGAAHTLNNLGLVYAEKDDYDQAIAFHNKALSIRLATLGEQHPDVAASYGNLGNVYVKKDDYDQAIAFHHKALSIGLTTLGEQHPNVANYYLSLGVDYYKKNDYEQAITFYNKALTIYLAKFGEQNPRVADCYHNLGLVYDNKDDLDQALGLYNKALKIFLATVGKQHPTIGTIYNHFGVIYDRKRDYDRALAFYNRALSARLTTLGKLHPEVAGTYNNLGIAYRNKGDYAQALHFYQQGICANVREFNNNDPHVNPTLKNIISDSRLLSSLADKAQTLNDLYFKVSHNLRDLETAVSTYQLAIQLIDQMRHSYKAEGSKLVLAEQGAGLYDLAIRAARNLYVATRQSAHLQTVFQFAEKSKTGIMLDALAEAEAKAFANIPDSLLAKERQLRIDLAFYEKSLTEEQLSGPNADSAKVALWQDKVFNLKQAYDTMLQRFEKEFPDYYNLKYRIKTVSVPELQQQFLDDKTALVEYFTGEDSIFIFAITKDNFAVKTSAKDSLLERKIEQLRQGITQQDFDKYTQAAYRLYQTLLEPIASTINNKNLIIVPDGALSAIPFEALLTEPVAKGNLQDYSQLSYWVNDHAISYAYSATLLQQEQSRRNRQTKRDYLALAPIFAEGVRAGTRGADFFAENFGRDLSQTLTRMREGYLPDTKREVTGILDRFENSYGFFERWFGNRSRVYLEREANETRLKSKDIADYRFLHFATHGLINEKNPKLSGLLLAQEDSTSQEDGILHLGEIYNLSLNADLVVLSACETGLGQVAKGEGIIGLTRGFLYAGAKNLLVSLWQVSDVTTADLMVDFYDNMLKGAAKPEALAEAKRHIIRSGSARAKPDYWAPFILVGR